MIFMKCRKEIYQKAKTQTYCWSQIWWGTVSNRSSWSQWGSRFYTGTGMGTW